MCHLSCVNPKHAKFVAGVLSGKSQRVAYIAAGYAARGASADQAAAHLAAQPEIAAVLGLAEDKIIDEAVKLAIADTPLLLARLMKIVDDPDTKTRDLISAIKLLGDNLGTWTPKPVPAASPIDLSHLTEDAKRALLAALRASVVPAAPIT